MPFDDISQDIEVDAQHQVCLTFPRFLITPSEGKLNTNAHIRNLLNGMPMLLVTRH